MDMESVHTFITLAELKNFTKTAQKHVVVQSTVTKRIKELEKELGKELFERNQKGLKLTCAGEHFLIHAKQMAEIENHMRSELAVLDRFSRNIRVGAVHSFCCGGLSDYITGYRREYPETAIQIDLDHSNDLLNKLHDNELDICFTYRESFNPGYKSVPLIKDRIILVGASEVNCYPTGITIEELKKENILYASPAVTAQGWFDQVFGNNFHYAVETNAGVSLVPYIKNACGYGFVMESLVKKEIESGILEEITIRDKTVPEIWVYMVYREKDNTQIIEFVEYIESFSKT